MQSLPQIILKSGKDEAIKRYHPWIFSGAIKKIIGNVSDGKIVQIYSNKDEYLGTGHYQDASIAARILAFAPEKPLDFDEDFFYGKISKALFLRQSTGIANNVKTNVYRLIHGEGDNLPGLIIDFYNNHIVIQCHSIGMHKNINNIAAALKKLYGDSLKSIYDKSGETLPSVYAKENETNRFIVGEIDIVEVQEYGHRFNIDFINGQKTGFFIDQRENRHLLSKYSKGKTVLNTFCYSGGFSIYALKAGAKIVHSLDSSKKAIELTDSNVMLNFISEDNHKSIVADTMEYLDNPLMDYDIIILDPPAYAKHVNVKHNAVQGYKRLNQKAISQIKSGSFLFTFSCSQVIDMNLFKSTVISASIAAKRKVRIIHQLSQPADHPINAFHPEGSYLKGLVLFIE
ncbi:MAG: class I SAM-dependent rRNA methyltransferase [Bacteroidota bacterium]